MISELLSVTVAEKLKNRHEENSSNKSEFHEIYTVALSEIEMDSQ